MLDATLGVSVPLTFEMGQGHLIYAIIIQSSVDLLQIVDSFIEGKMAGRKKHDCLYCTEEMCCELCLSCDILEGST